MRTVSLAALAAVMSLAVAPAPAGAEEPFLTGSECSSTWLHDPTTDDWIGEIDGGPLVVADLGDLAANPVSATLICSIQVDEPTYAGTDVVSASGTGQGVVVVAPTPFRIEAEPEQWPYFCLELLIHEAGGGTRHYYWDYGYSDGKLSTSDTANCSSGACTQEGPFGNCPDGPGPGPFDNDFWFGFLEKVDAVACIPLKLLYPPEGDVPDIWDCPPYGN